MRILLVQLLDYRFPFGGAHKANRRLMEALAARGHECQVFAPGYETVTPRPDERERLLADLAAEGAPVVAEEAEEERFVVYRSRGVVVHALVSEFSLAGYGPVYGHLARQIRELRPDWVLVSEDHTGLFLGTALELAPGRVVYIAHAQPTLPFGPEAFDQDPAKAALFGRVAGILTVSDYVRGYIRQWGGFESTVVGFPVYGEPPFPRFGRFDQGAVTLVNASGLKGLPIFLDLAAAFPEVPFTAVASWGTGAAERAALAALSNVTLREPSPEIDEVLAGARVLLAPSLWGEAFGVIAVEAMLRGIPVLASDLGGLPEAKLGVDYVLPVSPITVYHRPSPFEKPVPVLPPQDTAPWRRALGRVLTERGQYERLAEESRRAALAFVAGLGAPAFEAYLRGLEDPREAPRKAPGGSTLPHILMSTHGTHGDVLPFLTLGEELVRRGHRVTLVTHAVFADLARAAGIELIGLGDEESYRRLIEDTAELFTRPDDIFAASRAYLERQKIFDDDREELRRIDAACTEDTVLVGRYEDVATLLVAEKRGLPLAWVLLSPSQIATARVRAELFGGDLLGRLQELRAEAGLPPIASYTDWLARADRSLALWPGWLSDPEPQDLEAVGFVLNEPIETEPLPAAVEALLAQRPLLVSSGTTKIIRPEFFTATLEAASRARIPVLALTRHRELLPGTLPAGCHWFSYLPFTRLLPRVRAVVHHGGIGTIAHALAAGAPQLILAEGVDRPDNARRLARAGAAESLKPADWTPERIGQALGRLCEPAFAERCRALAEETRGSCALAAACDRIVELAGGRATAPADAPAAPRAAAGPASVADTRLSQLSPEKRALLALRLAKKKGAGQRGIPRLPRAGAEAFFPLSFAQERFWFLEQLKDQRETGGETVEAYTVAVASYHLAGPFRNDLLERSLDELARRHEVFRTSFPEIGGVPRQRVLREGRIPLEVEDLRHVPPGERPAVLRERIRAEYRRGFDLAQGPLLRVLLLELGGDERLLVFTLHHLIYDGWSVRIFLEELTQLYRAALADAPAALPPLPVQYADFADWQRQWLAGERLDSLLAYWRGHLAGATPVLDLPVDRARPGRQSFRGSQRCLVLDGSLTGRLRELAHAEGVSLSMIFKAGFDVLLHRYTQESDFVVGVPTAGRDQAETEGLIGVFINLLAIRSQVAGGESLRQLLPRVRHAVLEGAEHQALPFERLVAELAPARDLSRHPLFQVLFAFNQRTRESACFQGAITTWYETDVRHARVDLALEVSEEPDKSVTLALELSTDLFDPATIDRMARQLAVLLGGLAEAPEGAVARLPLLTPEERGQLLPESAAPVFAFPPEGVHELFARQAARRPEAWAVVTPEERITFGGLSRLANGVATHLLKAGGTAGEVGPVALLLPNGIHHVAAMIGVLQAGGSFVCLDPEYPAARLRQIVHDLRPAALLADEAHAALAAELAMPVETLEAIAARPAPEPVVRPTTPAAPVYVAYTSGSTGQPKGIVQTHGGFRHLIEWYADHFQIAPGKIVAQWIAVGHDPCYVEVWSALVTGATLSVAPAEIRRDPAALHHFLGEEAIAVIQMTPSLCRQILDFEIARGAGDGMIGLPALEAVLLTGEALPVPLARDWLAHFGPRPALHNVYGPTESILVTSHHVAAVDPATISIPVGAPIAGCRIFVLDGSGEACPLGVPGELYVRSPFLASGYHGMPEATARAFVQNPLAVYPDRVYRTGDFGRFRADGTLEFRGRADRQVKLRGQRLELGEVEAVLARHPGVEECAVEVQTSPDGDQRLAAWAVTRDGLTVVELRAWLARELPPFMVPGSLLLPASLPRTATGKVDYAALRDLPVEEPRAGEQEEPLDEAPASAEEEIVGALFAEYLRRDRVGRREDFFALGGHSLLAALVANRLREHYLLDLRVRDVFTHPTPAGLAGFIACERRRREEAGFADRLQQALAQVHDLSEEDAGRLLSSLAEPSA